MSYSMNPYAGCEHGCIYCYARNTHEYYGFSAGLDFERKIIIKRNAPELLEQQPENGLALALGPMQVQAGVMEHVAGSTTFKTAARTVVKRVRGDFRD